MPPEIIDLTSSPESEESPATALENWKPRKGKTPDSANGRSERRFDDATSPNSRAAQSALAGFKPRKEKAHLPVESVTVAAANTTWSSLATTTVDHARTESPKAQNEEATPAMLHPQPGSLAALLQLDTPQQPLKPLKIKHIPFSNGQKNETVTRAALQQSSSSNGRPVRPERSAGIRQQQQGDGTNTQSTSRTTPQTKQRNGQAYREGQLPIPPASALRVNAPTKAPTFVSSSKQDAQLDPAERSYRAAHNENELGRAFKRRRVDGNDTWSPGANSDLRYSGNTPAITQYTSPLRFTHAAIPLRSVSPASTIAESARPALEKDEQPDTVDRRPSNDPLRVAQSHAATVRGVQVTNTSRSRETTDEILVASKRPAQATMRLPDTESEITETTASPHEKSFSGNPYQTLIERSEALHAIQEKPTKPMSPALSRRRTLTDSNSRKNDKEVPARFRKAGVQIVGGGPYTTEEDALLIKLKEADGLSWDEIATRFAGSRTRGSLQVRYSTTLSKRTLQSKTTYSRRTAGIPNLDPAQETESTESDAASRPVRKRRNNDISATAGFISWAEVKDRRIRNESEPLSPSEDSGHDQDRNSVHFAGERAHPRSLLRSIRHREFGFDAGGTRSSTSRRVSDEMKERVLDDIGPTKYYKGTSGDVTCIAWAPNGESFAAGSIAITDERSMQYNRPNNLLFGMAERGLLQELPEHHIQRPIIEDDSSNANGLHSMRETQDTRLFMTVASVQFSPDGDRLYSAGSDQKVRAYQIERNRASHVYELEHIAPLDLLSVSNFDILATACHSSADKSIAIYKGQHRLLELSPDRKDEQTDRAIYPSALRWGSAYRHSHYLLAGFALIDSADDERNIAGETCLWDVQHGSRLKIHGVTRKVFDVAWNPIPSSSSSVFAVASARGTGSTSRGTRSVIQCFGANTRRTIGWECPAFDINDVVYCRHDDNLIAAGGTDGKIYIWDQRFVARSSRPVHVLEHGDTLNVLDHDRDREIADTGVRFVSWGATSSRLYTGSSDGVVKVWNPYRSTENAHVKDVAIFGSAVMSGAFSPDHRDLLVGEDQGRINLLSVGNEHKAVRSMQRFEIQSATAPTVEKDRLEAARELQTSGQIAFRRMGDLPKRQAVQGPNYRGPYLKPSVHELTEANHNYELALNAQNEADLLSSPDGENNEALQQATKRVHEAQARLMKLQSRLDDSHALEPIAAENQQRFIRIAKASFNDTTQRTESCKLDCDYLPSRIDDDGEVPDSRRSEMRIPGVLRSLRPPDTAAMPLTDDPLDSTITYQCISCFSPASKPSSGKQPLCERCYLVRTGMTASCTLCSNPMRPSTELTENSNRCEKCNFACFRCGKADMIERGVSMMTCRHCDLTWRAGALGYERTPISIRKRPNQLNEEMFDDSLGLGDEQIEHYASRWQTRRET